MPNTKPYNKEEVVKEFEEKFPTTIDYPEIGKSETLTMMEVASRTQRAKYRDSEIVRFWLNKLTAAEQAGEERMKKPLREALRMLEDEIPYTSEEVVMRIKEALK